MASATKKPWIVAYGRDSSGRLLIKSKPTGNHICSVSLGCSEEAHANMIIAAPEMLEACEMALAVLSGKTVSVLYRKEIEALTKVINAAKSEKLNKSERTQKMDEKFTLGQKVKIVATGMEGTVVGVWNALASSTQYNVRYYDSTGRPGDFWFYASDLTTD